MQDRELLELAAKAANLRWSYDLNLNVWNPLEDDGDALRLAVKLGMNLDVSGGRACALVSALPGSDEQLGEDHCKAMRRAIVREAAEIGRKQQIQQHFSNHSADNQ